MLSTVQLAAAGRRLLDGVPADLRDAAAPKIAAKLVGISDSPEHVRALLAGRPVVFVVELETAAGQASGLLFLYPADVGLRTLGEA